MKSLLKVLLISFLLVISILFLGQANPSAHSYLLWTSPGNMNIDIGSIGADEVNFTNQGPSFQSIKSQATFTIIAIALPSNKGGIQNNLRTSSSNLKALLSSNAKKDKVKGEGTETKYEAQELSSSEPTNQMDLRVSAESSGNLSLEDLGEFQIKGGDLDQWTGLGEEITLKTIDQWKYSPWLGGVYYNITNDIEYRYKPDEVKQAGNYQVTLTYTLTTQ